MTQVNYQNTNEEILKKLKKISIQVYFADKGEITEPYATEYREELQYITGIALARMDGESLPADIVKGATVKPCTGKVRIVGEDGHIAVSKNHELTINRIWYEGKGQWSLWVRGLPTAAGYRFNTDSRRLYMDDFEMVL